MEHRGERRCRSLATEISFNRMKSGRYWRLYRILAYACVHQIGRFSARRAEIEAAMKAQGFGDPADNRKLAERASLMTPAHKHDVDKGELRRIWERQVSELGFSPQAVLGRGRGREVETSIWGKVERDTLLAGKEYFVSDAVNWAEEHLGEREAVFSRADLLAVALSYEPRSATVQEVG